MSMVTERNNSYLKFLFDQTVTGFRYDTSKFMIKMCFCYGAIQMKAKITLTATWSL